MKQTIATAAAISSKLIQLSDDVRAACPDPARLVLIGIQRRGVELAQRMAALIAAAHTAPVPLGSLDITFYRDDLSMVAQQPIVHSTNIPFSLDGMHVVLVDDVLHTGRTIRAALDALMDFGRPDIVRLLVLVDRGMRELPIQPDLTGWKLSTKAGQMVRVRVKELDGEDVVELLDGNAS